MAIRLFDDNTAVDVRPSKIRLFDDEPTTQTTPRPIVNPLEIETREQDTARQQDQVKKEEKKSFLGKVQDVVGSGFNFITDKLSRTKFFTEVGEGLEIEAQEGLPERKVVTALGTATRSLGNLVDTFVASPLNFTSRAIFGKETEVGTMFADTADKLREIGTTQVSREVQETPFSLDKVKDPAFWMTTVAENIPVTLGFFAAAKPLFTMGSAGAMSVLTSGRFATQFPKLATNSTFVNVASSVAGGLAGGTVMRGFESATEAEEVFKQAKEMGMSDSDAISASKNAFARNLALVGLDAGQVALALSPFKFPGKSVLGRVVSQTAKLGAAGVTEGGEEIFQQRASKLALGQDFDIRDPENLEAGFVGAVMGALFQGTGQISQARQQKVANEYMDRVASKLSPELQKEYAGLEQPQHKLNFLDRVSNQQKEAVQSAVVNIENEKNQAVQDTKDTIDEIGIFTSEQVTQTEGDIDALDIIETQENVPIEKLEFIGDDFDVAQKRVAEGVKSQTEGNIIVERNDNGTFTVQDGSHRIAEALERGEKTFTVDLQRGKQVSSTEKPSKVARSIEQKAIEQGLTKGFEGLAGFDPITVKDQSRRASEVVKKRGETLEILRGVKPIPEGLRGAALITAVEERIKKNADAELAMELANSEITSETSKAAQELRLLAEREPDSIAARLKEIRDARRESFKKKNKRDPKKAVKSEAKKIKKELKKATPTRESWEEFVTNLTC